MKKKKLLIIIPIILIILILIGAGGFAFIYFKTDLFKSPKELFYKYVGQTLNFSEDFDYDKFLSNYKSISEKSTKSTGEISFNINTDISEAKEITDILNKSKLNYNLSRIPNEEKSYITVGATYDGKEFTRFEGIANGDNYGIKCGDLYNKYIYIENNNLQALAKRFGISNSSIPDKINKIDVYDLLYISKDTRKEITNTYYKLLDSKLDDNKFTINNNVETSVNGENLKTNSYSLELTQKETYEILISILETLKNDDTFLDLIVEKAEKSNFKDSFEKSMNYRSIDSTILDSSSTTSTVTFDKNYLKEKIQDLIDSLNNELKYCEDSNKVKLTVYSYKGNTVKFEINISDLDNSRTSTLEITKNKHTPNILSINIENNQIFKMEYTKNNETFSGNATINYDSMIIPIEFDILANKDLTKSHIKFTLPAEEFYDMDNEYFTDDVIVELNSEISGELGKDTNSNTSYISISSGKTLAKLTLKQDITYTDDITIGELNSNTGICLNTAQSSEIENAIKEIITNFRKVLPNKLQTLGIDLSNLNNSEETISNSNNNYSEDGAETEASENENENDQTSENNTIENSATNNLQVQVNGSSSNNTSNTNLIPFLFIL